MDSDKDTLRHIIDLCGGEAVVRAKTADLSKFLSKAGISLKLAAFTMGIIARVHGSNIPKHAIWTDLTEAFEAGYEYGANASKSNVLIVPARKLPS